jgi:putative transposase
VLKHIRSDNGPEMTAKVVRNWLKQVGAQALYIELGSPNGKLRDEPLKETQVLIE